MLDADPLFVGSVFVEDDSGTDAQGDQFYVAFQGGSETTQLRRIVIDGSQDGDPTSLTEPDVYFDTDASNQTGAGTGSGGAQGFVFGDSSVGISEADVSVQVEDGGTRIILDVENFEAGDLLVFSIDVDQFFANKPDDQITSGIEFAGSSLTTVFDDPHYDIQAVSTPTNGVYQYNYGFGSDEVADTGLLSILPSQEFRSSAGGFQSNENRTAGALDELTIAPKPVSIAGTVWHDRNLDLNQDSGEEGIAGVTLLLQKKDASGFYVDVPSAGNSTTTTLTDADGNYEFGIDLGLQPGTYRVVQTQPADYEYSVGEVPGTVAGVGRGTTDGVLGNVLAEIEIPLGDQHAIDYDFAEAKAASLCGTVYHDRNNNGVQDAGEEGIGNVDLLIAPIQSIGNQAPVVVTTNPDGTYCAEGLAPGEYEVVELVQPPGFQDGIDTPGMVDGVPTGMATNPGDRLSGIVLVSGSRGTDYDFGEIMLGSLSGHVKLSSPDGTCLDHTDPAFRPIAGVEIQLLDDQGILLRSTMTDAQGSYTFADLQAGTYTIVEVTPPDFPYLNGMVDIGQIDGVVVGANLATDVISQITLGAGDHGVNYDFCEHEAAKISGFVYHDVDDDGLREAGEAAIAGATIELFDENGNSVGTTTTDSQGYYEFNSLYAGTYRVVETQPDGYVDGKDTAGTIDGLTVGDADSQLDEIGNIQILGGQVGVDYNFGEIRYGSIGGRVHTDINGNCELEAGLGEIPLEGVLIELLDHNGQTVDLVLTDAQGNYQFENLLPGTYSVIEHHPNGYFHGGQSVGVDADTGLTGPGMVAGDDHISSITLLSDTNLVHYDFCEHPPGSISGFVYQDGAALLSIDGSVPGPLELLNLRDGQRSSDDTPISGVILELRHGVTGEPIVGEQAAPGAYASGPIRTTTDANGYYEFKGLPAGNYAVFQVHPDGYVDHVDTPGTTLGVAINPTVSNTVVLSTLSSGIDPKNDAILRIALGVGGQSSQNNFSEVKVESPPIIIPPVVPQLTTVLNVPPPTLPPAPVLELAGQLPVTQFTLSPFVGGGQVAYSWHLSIIDGGIPRGQFDPSQFSDDRFQSIAHMSKQRWSQITLADGSWILTDMDKEDAEPSETTMEQVYGIEGGIPITGDFNGDGIDEVAIYRDGEWFIDLNGNGRWDEGDLWAELGTEKDQPVTGDWDGDGKDDIGIFGPIWPRDEVAIEREPGLPDPANVSLTKPKNLPPQEDDATEGRRSIKLTINGQERDDLIDHVFAYGNGQDKPITGDWNGDGIRTIGIFNDGEWVLDSDGNGRMEASDQVVQFGQAGDLPVIGDFNGDGIEEIGVFRDGMWIIDSNGNLERDAADKVFELGEAGDLPIVGDFDGDGVDDPGLYRSDSVEGPRQAG